MNRRMAEGSIIGRYARVVIDDGTDPLRKGSRFACRVTGVTSPIASERRSILRGEIVSNDVDGPLPSTLLEASVIITPDDPDISESRILQGGSFRAKLRILTTGGNLIATGEGELTRISEEIPYEGLCPDCHGWKICEDCGGTGGDAGAECRFCGGTGHCVRCGGRGSVTEIGDVPSISP